MTLAILNMRLGAAFLRHQLPARTLSKQTGITKTAFSSFLHLGFPSLRSSSQSSSALVSRINIPRIAPQLAIQFRFFSCQKGGSDSTLHFPDAVTITQYLSNHPLLKTDYYQEKGITKAIAELAAARFADNDIMETGVKIGAMLLIIDLLKGIDGFTGESLPNLGKLGLPPKFWTLIAMATEKALIDCANSVAYQESILSLERLRKLL